MQTDWDNKLWLYRPLKRQFYGATALGVVTWIQWYQPKWQRNDYYLNNYRINEGDTVKLYTQENTAFGGGTWSTPTAVKIKDGAA